MSQNREQIWIDLFAAQKSARIANEQLPAILDAIKDDSDKRLSQVLVDLGIAKPQELDAIDESGQMFSEHLSRLESQFSEDEHSRADLEEFETFMESPSGITPSGDGSVSELGSRGHVSSGPGGQRFQKEKPHAEGGLGRVWVASDTELNRTVALKEIQPTHADDPNCRLRFVQEAEITGSLEHPGIVPVYGLGSNADGRPYYAMRLIDGKTLKQAIDELFRESPPRPFRDVKWTQDFRKVLMRFLQVCNAIEYAHSRNVIHRDIKPSNIMLGAYGETLVVDWGLAKSLLRESVGEPETAGPTKTLSGNSALSVLGSAVGTPAYMSYEQATGGVPNSVGPKSDVYSLGATLYHLLTGLAPMQTSGTHIDLAKIKEVAEQSVLNTRPDVPKPLASICDHAMALEPSDRYESAGEIADDIENWMNDSVVSSYKESLIERTARWCRSHQTIFATAAVSCVLVIAATAGAFVLRRNHQFDLNNEKQQRDQIAQSHRQQVLAAATASEASALAEVRNGRFEAALEFLDQAIDHLEQEEDTDAILQGLASRRERTGRLVDFYRMMDEAQDATYLESSRRASTLFQLALDRLGVFQQLEWWNALPSDDLSVQQLGKLREDAYSIMYLLVSLRLKETLPAKYEISDFLSLAYDAKGSNSASTVLFDLMDAFRESQGAKIGRDFAQNRLNTLQQVASGFLLNKQAIEWEPKNASDLYIMGSALTYFSEFDKTTQDRFETVLGIKDAGKVAHGMLSQAAELRPDHYYTQMMMASAQLERGKYEDAYRSYTNAIALRKNHFAAYHWRGRGGLNQAIALKPNTPGRTLLLQKAERDIERAIDANPRSMDTHRLLGDALSWSMHDTREVVPHYVRALMCAEPLDRIRDVGIENSRRSSIQSMRNWLEAVAKAESKAESDPLRYVACLAWCELLLNQMPAAKAATQRAFEIGFDPIAAYVVAELAMTDGQNEVVAKMLDKIEVEMPDWYQAHELRGRLAESQNDWDAAKSAYAVAMTNANSRWKSLAAAKGLCRIAIRQRDEATATKMFLRAKQVDPAEEFSEIHALLEQHPLGRTGEFVDRHRQMTVPISALASTDPVIHPALMNGGFELGRARYWGDTLDKIDEPAWARTGGSRALANTSAVSHSGNLSLHVSNAAVEEKGVSAQLRQTFPIVKNQRYKLNFWCKSDGCEKGSLIVRVNNKTVATADQGKYDWKLHAKVFTCETDSATLRIICKGKCDLYLDDLIVVRQNQ